MDFIEIEIINWSKYNRRGEIKTPRWFALNNRILEDPLFAEFTHEEIVAWIYILCQASQKNSSRISLFFKHANRVCSISKTVLLSTIDKMEKAQAIQRHDRAANANVRATITTLQDITVQSPIVPFGENLGSVGEKEKVTHRLMEIWNEHRESLPSVKELNPKRLKGCRQRWAECSDPAQWASVIHFLANDKFFSGNNEGGWRANFDYLLRPSTRVQILERIDSPTRNNPEQGVWLK